MLGYQAHLNASGTRWTRRRGQAGGLRPLHGVWSHTEHAAETSLHPGAAPCPRRPVSAALPTEWGRALPLGSSLTQGIPLPTQRSALTTHARDPVPLQPDDGWEALRVTTQPAHDACRADVTLLAARVWAVTVQPAHLLRSVAVRCWCWNVLIYAAVPVCLAGPVTHHVSLHHGRQCGAGVVVATRATAAPPTSTATTTSADGEYTPKVTATTIPATATDCEYIVTVTLTKCQCTPTPT